MATSPENRSGQGSEGTERELKPADYLKAARIELRNGKEKAAYQIMMQAMLHFPDEPLVLSYCGSLQAIVDRKYRTGIDACRRAIALFKPGDAYAAGVIFPILYLNLGRAFVAAKRKEEAIEAFRKGQRFDRSHAEIKKELLLLGVRKAPPVSFLSRSNPINKYIGLLLHKTGKAAGKTSSR